MSEFENPYQKMREHRKAGGHAKTYVAETTGRTICEDCGEILDEPVEGVKTENA